MSNQSVVYRSFDSVKDPERAFRFRKDVEEIDHDGMEISLEMIRAQLDIPGHDPVRDRDVVCLKGHPGTMIAYSSVWPANDTADVQIVVHPSHRRQGIGTELLTRLLERCIKHGIHVFHGYAQHTNTGGNAFLVHRGFLMQGAYCKLCSSRLPLRAVFELPVGFTLRTYADIRNPVLLAEAMNESYRGLWGHQEGDLEQVAGWVESYPEECRFMLFDPKSRLAGVCCTRMVGEPSSQNDQRTAYIDAPGLLPGMRGRELYRNFLCAVVDVLVHRGAVRADMESWGDRTETIQTYGELGFEIAQKSTAYRLERPA